MDLITAENVVTLILGVLSSGLYEAIISSSNKLKNCLDEEKDIGDCLEIKEEVFEEIIWEKLTLEEFNEIGGIKQIRDFFDLGLTEDIMKKLYLFDFVGNNNHENKDCIRNEFCQLFIQHFEIKNNTNAVSIVLLKLFDVFDECCQKFLDTSIWKEESLPAHEILSKRRFREVCEKLEKLYLVLAEIKFLKQMESLDHRRKEATNQEIMSCYNSSELPKYPEKLKKFVTENRTNELRKSLSYLEIHRVLLISGVGGVGKSTLARALIELRPTNVPEPFWFSFYDNQDAKLGDILEKLASYMNAPAIASFKAEKREPGKTDVDKLVGELYRISEVWLIFDDLSMVLEDQHFADKGIEFLFSSLRFNTHKAKVIATSRILPILGNGESFLDEDDDEEKQYLSGLRTNFAVNYLASNGLDKIEHEKLAKLATGVDGHPLALKLLVNLVKKHGVVNILSDLSIYQDQKENTIKKARNLFDKLAGDEKELLERISVYREPVKRKGLKVMFTEKTPKDAIEKLIDKSLLENALNGNYWLHPLVQEFSYDDLKNKKEAHMIAYRYYCSLPIPEESTKKEDIQPVIEAHHHACEAREYNLAAQIIFHSKLNYYLDVWGDWTTLVTLHRRLLPDEPLKDEVLLSSEMKIFVFSDLGLTYQKFGYVRRAIEYHEQALKIAKEIGDKRREGEQLGNLGSAYQYLSEFRLAIKYHEQSLRIAKDMGDKRREGEQLGDLGSVYQYLSEFRRVIEYHEQALKIAKEMGDKRRESSSLGKIGLAYNDLSEFRRAIEYFEKALKISHEIVDRRGESSNLGKMGLAYSYLGEHQKAIDYYKQSLKVNREIGYKLGEGANLGNIGSVYHNLGVVAK